MSRVAYSSILQIVDGLRKGTKKKKRKKETMFINSKHTKVSNGKSGLSSMRRADLILYFSLNTVYTKETICEW